MPSKTRRAVIVTALPIERVAVIEHLRDVSEEPPLQGSIYRRGIFDDRSEPWEVIVAEIGPGNVAASAEAARVVSHYAPEVALFVGVAGAVKDLNHGDVVAATKVYGYESGKEGKGGFDPRPVVQLPAYALEQRARHEAGEPDWHQRIRPSQGPSRKVVPVATVGPIVAGEKVVGSNRSQTYKFIRRQYGDAVAVEMEGLGFLLGVHMSHPTLGLVVRGISDLVEGKDELNDKTWQPIAARHAAAFAFQVLAKLPPPVENAGGASADAKRIGADTQLDAAWQEKHLQEATATAGPRYSSELQIGTPLHDVFEALGNTEEWRTAVRVRGRKLSKLVKRFLDCLKTKDDRGWGEPFPENLRDDGHALAERLKGVGQRFAAITDTSSGATAAGVAEAATAVLPDMRGLQAALRSDLEERHGEGTADSASFRQYQAEYQMKFPAANLDMVRDIVTALEELETWGRSGPGRASGSKGVLLLGDAGVGKTHGICDIAHDRHRRGLYTVVLFGEHFNSNDEPWERIRQLLGFGPISRDAVLAALDAAGARSGVPLLFCIDGLNESRPRGYWRSWLPSLATQVAGYPNVRLCVSCRSTYEPLTVPEGHGLERVNHLGFAGMEFTACRQYFLHYGLEPPVAPSFHPEFSNPLFLRLACETLRAAGARRMPTGWHGLNTAFKAFLREKNKAFAIEHERDAREQIPQKALHEFMAEVEQAGRAYLRWSDATAAVGRAQPISFVGPSVLQWLVSAGLLIADVDPEDSSLDAEEVVRVAFERLGDHLLAERLLSNIRPGGLTAAIESGPLSFAFADDTAIINNQGLVQALSIQLPEHAELSTELVDVLPAGCPRDAVLRATITALPWRAPEHMATRTQDLVLEGLATRGYGYEVLDNLLSVAAQVTAPDALWLHDQLSAQAMPQRDGFLCGYLHTRIGSSNAVERLLQAPFEVESAHIAESVLVRWATLLLWFCSAADRRVRDRATKGLIAITQASPKVWVTLIRNFASVDDESVVERCFCAAYGTLLRSRDPEAEMGVATAAYEVVFTSQRTVVQNAVIRDHVRCIIELAQLDGVLPANIKVKRVRPPYTSDWPLDIPSEQDVERYKGANRDYPKLYRSCLGDDFFTYILSRLDDYEHAISRNEMGRWILNHVISEMGYGGQALASYDHHILHTYGSGRGRPGWAERIGKKYQWIALNRLAARLADHVKPSNRWGQPKARTIPLVYAAGRDIDPSLLADGGLPSRKCAVWWLPVEYDFAAVAGQSEAEWTAASVDVPSSEKLLQPLARVGGGEWQLLEGHPSWSASTPREDDDEDSAPHREVWTQIRGYLVARKSSDRVFKWMSKQDFFGRWMPEGSEYHEGYVGEYPWGILFTMFPERWHSGGGSGKPPARLIPVSNSVSAKYGEDAYQRESISVVVPARRFFEVDGQLRWDGLSGYRDGKGRLRFLDPSTAEPGPSALLVERSYLLDFLKHHELAIVWSVLGEKLLLGGRPDAYPRVTFSRAHLMDQSGVLRSSNLIVRTG